MDSESILGDVALNAAVPVVTGGMVAAFMLLAQAAGASGETVIVSAISGSVSITYTSLFADGSKFERLTGVASAIGVAAGLCVLTNALLTPPATAPVSECAPSARVQTLPVVPAPRLLHPFPKG